MSLPVDYVCQVSYHKTCVYGIVAKHVSFIGYSQWSTQTTRSEIVSNLKIGEYKVLHNQPLLRSVHTLLYTAELSIQFLLQLNVMHSTHSVKLHCSLQKLKKQYFDHSKLMQHRCCEMWTDLYSDCYNSSATSHSDVIAIIRQLHHIVTYSI